MSGKDNFNKDELIKSLAESAGITEEEAAQMINDDKFNEIEKSQKSEEEDEYSEDKEKEMEKAMNEAKEAYDAYKAKKPKVEVQKSENNDLGGSTEGNEEKPNDDLLKSVETMFGGFSESFNEKLGNIEKSLDVVDEFKEELSLLKSQIEEIGNYTPPAKAFGMSNEVMIEKALDGGVKEDGKTYLSSKAHKEQIGTMLGELCEETTGDLQKSLETDLSNYVSGAGTLGATAKRLLEEKKNVVVG